MVSPVDWLKKAKSNLMIAKLVYKDEYSVINNEIFFEDLCFELQQCAEKSIKALLLFHDIEFPKTHNLVNLINLLKIKYKNLPEDVLSAGMLTQYSVTTRYPDDTRKITEEEYVEALKIAEDVYNWVKMQVESRTYV